MIISESYFFKNSEASDRFDIAGCITDSDEETERTEPTEQNQQNATATSKVEEVNLGNIMAIEQ